MELRKQDVETLRTLGQKYMGYATLPVQREKRELWRSLNRLEMQKPMFTMDQLPWNELEVDPALTCTVEQPYFRNLELQLRRTIYKWEHLPADMVLEPYILLDRPLGNTGYAGYGLDFVQETRGDDPHGIALSRRYVPQIVEPEDIEKIKTPRFVIDEALEEDILQTAHFLFDGIAPVRWRGVKLHLGLWDFISQWMSMTTCCIELIDRPEFMHAIMEKLTQATLEEIEEINRLGIYDTNENLCHCSHTFDDKVPGAAFDPAHPTTHDGWAFGLAQLFSSCSPAVTAEFEVPYMQRIFPHFGAIYYGCCEKLDDRLDILARMPNIRKISCSPWSDREHFAATLPKCYVMSNKPSPALLATDTFDEDAVREDLRRTIRAAKANGLALEMLLKDVTTVRCRPERLWRWSQIAEEETLRAAL